MPRFYIHVQDSNGLLRDAEGLSLANVDAARLLAVHAAADIMAEELKMGCAGVQLTLVIEDANHSEIMKIPVTASMPS